MLARRLERVGERIHQEISDLLLKQVKDPRLTGITVTGVKVTPDLKVARVFVSVIGDEDERAAAQAALERAKGYIRREVARSVQLRFAPDLQFVMDDSWSRGSRVDELLEQLQREDSAAGSTQGDSASDRRD